MWRVHGVQGGTWYVKVHQNERFHGREVRGLRTWAPELGAAAPRLVAADETLWAVVLTAVPGRPLHGAVRAPERERKVFQRIGALARRIHQASPPRPAPAGSGPAVAKADGTWLGRGRICSWVMRSSSASSSGRPRTCNRWSGWRPTAISSSATSSLPLMPPTRRTTVRSSWR